MLKRLTPKGRNLQQRELLPILTAFPFNPSPAVLTATGTNAGAKVEKNYELR
jgi:hypothetical protein